MSGEIDAGLAARIRECAEIVGSGAELSRLSGINRRTLERYLAGESSPAAGALGSIAVAAGVSLDWLILGKGPKKAEDKWALVSGDARRFGLVMDRVERAYAREQAEMSGLEYSKEALQIYERIWDLEDDDEFEGALSIYVNQLRRRISPG